LQFAAEGKKPKFPKASNFWSHRLFTSGGILDVAPEMSTGRCSVRTWESAENSRVSQWLKPLSSMTFTARLKPGPFKTNDHFALFQHFGFLRRTGKPSPAQNQALVKAGAVAHFTGDAFQEIVEGLVGKALDTGFGDDAGGNLVSCHLTYADVEGVATLQVGLD
jgi:hypothetical protein